MGPLPSCFLFRVVQLDFTPEIEVICMLFEGTLSILQRHMLRLLPFLLKNPVGPPCIFSIKIIEFNVVDQAPPPEGHRPARPALQLRQMPQILHVRRTESLSVCLRQC